jgi:hypothetical protein
VGEDLVMATMTHEHVNVLFAVIGTRIVAKYGFARRDD